MFAPPTPPDEDDRLQALHSLGLLDTPPEARFDRITRIASVLARVPMALVCFVDAQRQWFKSSQGLDVIETSRESSFCGHTILREEALVVPDAVKDPRFADNPLVIGPPFVRFYAGHPIHSPGGARIGTLCVLDTRPRELSSHDRGALADLAAMVDAEILAARFNIATRTVGIGVHERHVGNRDMWWSDAMWDILGQDPRTFRPSADNWLALVHPDDRDQVRAHGSVWDKTHTSMSLQYRIVRPDGTVRHLQTIASRTERQDASTDRIAGITLDITERTQSEQRASGLQQQLRDSSHQAGMAEVATGVLHSVGNVVNSLGIAQATMRRDLKAMRLAQLQQAAHLLHANRGNLADFLTEDANGRHLPAYLTALAAQIAGSVKAIQAELDTKEALLQEVRDILSAQQVRANIGNMREDVDLKDLIAMVVRGQALELPPTIKIVCSYEDLPPVSTDRHKILFILVNLLNNARDAVLASVVPEGQIMVRLAREEQHAVIVVEDSGVGMSAENLERLWRFGYTTKPTGQGFDLHNSANAAHEIGAAITAHSDGPNKGSRFVVRLPIVGTGLPLDFRADTAGAIAQSS